jgi:hypothetical protein
MHRFVWIALAACVTCPSAAAGREITPEAHALARMLDAMDVEHLWLPHRYVNWKTGEPLNRPVADGGPHTHCSAFVAAACLRLDVYILRSPDHPDRLLANAQYDWLRGKGRESGWRPVRDGAQAQAMANRGRLVVVAFRDADAAKPGHIAIVRPSAKALERIHEEGPQIIQAGMENARSTSVRHGFRHHHGAWPGGVRYFVHDRAPR